MKELQPCFRPFFFSMHARISKATFSKRKVKGVWKSAEEDQQQGPTDKGDR